MAHIRKRGKNSYLLVVEAGYDAKGKRIRRYKTVRCKTLREAEKELAKFVVEVEAGTYIAPEKMRFADFVEEWHKKHGIKHLSPKTLETYDLHLKNRILPAFGHMRLDEIKPIHIVSFLDELEKGSSRKDGKEGSLSPSTILYHYRILRDIFARAVEWKLIKSNPVEGVKRPKATNKKADVYDEQEVAQLFQLLQKEPLHARMLITLALTTGLRRGELLGLQWDDVDLENGVIHVNHTLTYTKERGYELKRPKTESSIRTVSLPPSVVKELKAYKLVKMKERMMAGDLWEGGEYFFVFSSWNGKPFYPTAPGTWWRRFIKRSGLRYIRFHDLRHTSATLLINQGVHAKIISERLGHSDIRITMNIYGHALRSADQEAAKKFDMILMPKEQQKQA